MGLIRAPRNQIVQGVPLEEPANDDQRVDLTLIRAQRLDRVKKRPFIHPIRLLQLTGDASRVGATLRRRSFLPHPKEFIPTADRRTLRSV